MPAKTVTCPTLHCNIELREKLIDDQYRKIYWCNKVSSKVESSPELHAKSCTTTTTTFPSFPILWGSNPLLVAPGVLMFCCWARLNVGCSSRNTCQSTNGRMMRLRLGIGIDTVDSVNLAIHLRWFKKPVVNNGISYQPQHQQLVIARSILPSTVAKTVYQVGASCTRSVTVRHPIVAILRMLDQPRELSYGPDDVTIKSTLVHSRLPGVYITS